MTTKVLSVPTIKCNGCVTAIKQALGKLSTINSVDIDLDSKQVTIDSEHTITDLVKAIKTAGFDALEDSFSTLRENS